MSLVRSLKLGFLTIITGLILWNFRFHLLGAGLVIAGVISLIVQAVNLRKPEFDRVLDERVERINEKSGFCSFWVLISSLAAFRALSWYFELELESVLEYAFLIGIFSFIIFRFHFSRG